MYIYKFHCYYLIYFINTYHDNYNIIKGVRGLLGIQCIKIGDIFFLCILNNFTKNVST